MFARKARAGQITLMASVALAGCGLSITLPMDLQRCQFETGAGWPSNPFIGTVFHNMPTHCPVRINGPVSLSYAATAQMRYGQWDRQIESFFFDDNWQITSGATFPWFTYASGSGSDTLDIVELNGTYPAASAMTSYQPGTDRAVHRIRRNFAWLEGTVRLSYEVGPPMSSVGANNPLPYESYSVTAYNNDPFLVPPVVYSWRLNGSPYTTGTQTINGYSGNMGDTAIYEITVTDANGTFHTHEHAVRTKLCDFVGCNDQLRAASPGRNP